MRSETFSHDPHRHAIIIVVNAPSSVVRGIRVRTSMSTIRQDPELVLITDLQKTENEETKINISEGLY